MLVGYFALTYKIIYIKQPSKLNSKMRSRIRKFAKYVPEMNGYQIAAPLIAQLGKNFTGSYDQLISGDELLNIACEKVKKLMAIGGGKIAYLECEDKPGLIAFYERNGFKEFDKRSLDAADRTTFKSDHLVQMIRYF